MRLREMVLISLVVVFTAILMYFIQVVIPKQMKDGEACYKIYLKK